MTIPVIFAFVTIIWQAWDHSMKIKEAQLLNDPIGINHFFENVYFILIWLAFMGFWKLMFGISWILVAYSFIPVGAMRFLLHGVALNYFRGLPWYYDGVEEDEEDDSLTDRVMHWLKKKIGITLVYVILSIITLSLIAGLWLVDYYTSLDGPEYSSSAFRSFLGSCLSQLQAQQLFIIP